MNVSIVRCGLDIGKKVFALIGEDSSGKVALKKKLNRHQVLGFFAQLNSCEVGQRR